MMDALAVLILVWMFGAVISLPGVVVIAGISMVYTVYWYLRRRQHPSERHLAGQRVKAGIIVSSILMLHLGTLGVLMLLRP